MVGKSAGKSFAEYKERMRWMLEESSKSWKQSFTEEDGYEEWLWYGIEEITGDYEFKARFSLVVLKAEKLNGKNVPGELIRIGCKWQKAQPNLA